ncbi:peptide N-acetyl-beta-D-glucosaminyl asparaginase amidase A-domain-containing protein [Thelonectria olida]|uniref:Peptide N-acetyl-beta-D-glucosaminyl asparaginase amidase A-domain-containing protein n=1 Tax=Thelonectria olida TaxID=1576542 RepID=A0A9P9AZ64_9HYPO|nr:peptide N-acetyl-beta-D-glucosaminyl asparaginase amidase A-domain-containing protein [Thelonectria olida]
MFCFPLFALFTSICCTALAFGGRHTWMRGTLVRSAILTIATIAAAPAPDPRSGSELGRRAPESVHGDGPQHGLPPQRGVDNPFQNHYLEKTTTTVKPDHASSSFPSRTSTTNTDVDEDPPTITITDLSDHGYPAQYTAPPDEEWQYDNLMYNNFPDHGYPVQDGNEIYEKEAERIRIEKEEERMRKKAVDSATLPVFQLTPPVLSPDGGARVAPVPAYVEYEGEPEKKTTNEYERMDLIKHSFSRPEPVAVQYSPPKRTFNFTTTPFDFNRVTLNLTVAAEGIQLDRLAFIYLGDVEIWRMTTAQPQPSPGVAWTFTKDVTAYLPLWKRPEKLIFDMRTSVSDIYTAPLDITLTATFFRTIRIRYDGEPADRVIPLTAERSEENVASAWTYPTEKASKKLLFPRNVRRAHVSVAATGRDDEEYWWSHIPHSQTGNFSWMTGMRPGGYGSGIREVRLAIDGWPAGIVLPFPTVFPGGIGVPMHRPVVPLQAFDLRETEIDITPWLPYLCNGKPHTFSMDVYEFEDDYLDPTDISATRRLRSVKVTAKHWILSAKIFLWVDEEHSITTGAMPRITYDSIEWHRDPGDVVKPWIPDTNQTTYALHIYRKFGVENSRVKSHKDDSEATWNQDLQAHNRGIFHRYTLRREVEANYKGKSQSFTGNVPFYHESFEYPISVDFDYRYAKPNESHLADGKTLVVKAYLAQEMVCTTIGKSAFPTGVEPWVDIMATRRRQVPTGTSVKASRRGFATYYQNTNGTMIMGISSSVQSLWLGMTPNSIRNIREGWIAEPALYTREVIFNGNKASLDKEWTYGYFTNPYDHRPSLAPSIAIEVRRAAQQPERFAPIGPGDMNRLFMGYNLIDAPQ